MKPEVWAPFPDFEGRYEISNHGRVKSVGTRFSPMIMKTHLNRDKYAQVCLYKDGKQHTQRVHRAVAKAFLENPEKLNDVDHINGVKSFNYEENLRWISESDNALNRYTPWGATGTIGVFNGPSQTNPYISVITVNGARHHLGSFPTVQSAKDAHETALKRLAPNV